MYCVYNGLSGSIEIGSVAQDFARTFAQQAQTDLDTVKNVAQKGVSKLQDFLRDMGVSLIVG